MASKSDVRWTSTRAKDHIRMPAVKNLVRELRTTCGHEPTVYCTENFEGGDMMMGDHLDSNDFPPTIAYHPAMAPYRDHALATIVFDLIQWYRVPEGKRLFPLMTMDKESVLMRRFQDEITEAALWLSAVDCPPTLDAQILSRDLHYSLVGNPADIRHQAWLYKHIPALRPLQRRSLEYLARGMINHLSDSVLLALSPTMGDAFMAMTAARILLVADMCRCPDLLSPFSRSDLDLGRRLLRLALDPGEDDYRASYAATDSWARELGLTGLVSWFNPLRPA